MRTRIVKHSWMPKLTTRIFDELHGYIALTELEAKIVDTAVFQRLRRIKQLSAAWLVYPGAVHTRFSHSLGVMYVMGIVAEKLAREGYIPEDDLQLLRVAALLHDIGHYPYSHTLETYYHMKKKGPSHEELARYIILRDPELSEIISDYGLDPWEIISIIEGRHREPVYNMLLGSDLDVDRADYLPRDALHTGVTYGVIDLHRIIDTLTVSSDGSLAIIYKGVHAVENFYTARLHMYQSVYYHKTIIAYESLLRLILESLFDEKISEQWKLEPDWVYKAINSGEYYYWDDYWVHTLLSNALTSEYISDDTKRMIKLFLNRRGLKTVVDLSRLSDTPLSEEEKEKLLEVYKEIIEEVPSKAVIIFVDSIPVVGEETAVKVMLPNKELVTITEMDTIVRRLPKYYVVVRIYADPMYVGIVRNLIEQKTSLETRRRKQQ